MPVNVVLKSNLDQVANWGKELDPHRDTLIVPDLKSKLEVQAELLTRVPVLEATAVLRASEFWRHLLWRIAPEIKVVTMPTIRVLTAQFLRDEQERWQIHSLEADLLLRYVEQLLPFLSHPRGEVVLQEWLESQSMSMIRWGRWFHLAKALWRHLSELKVLAPRWVPGFLSNQNVGESHWPRRLVFDLGPQLSGSEAELILQLSRNHDIEVLRPDPSFAASYFGALWTYDLLMEQKKDNVRMGAVSVDSLGDLRNRAGSQWRRHSTMLAEVKDVAAQVRLWLDQGALLSDIAICAPDVESYWPAMSGYLNVEGVPVLKSKVVSLAHLPQMTTWLSSMRVKLGSLGAEDLETFLFARAEESPIPHSEFRRLYRAIYDRADLERNSEVSGRILTETEPARKVSRDLFLDWALPLWPEREVSEEFESVLKGFLAETSAATEMSLDHWVTLLETIAVRTERTVEGSPREGVHLVNLESLDHLNVNRVYFMGVCDDLLRKSMGTAITLREVLDLSRHTGFHLSEPESSDREFTLRWLMTRSWKEWVVSYPVTDFCGEILTPSRLWVAGRMGVGRSVDELDPPRTSRWDEIQSLPLVELAHEVRVDVSQAAKFAQDVEVEMGVRPQESFAPEAQLSLSVSQWEGFKKCPFIFAAKKLFHLSDVPDLDLDPDAMGKGSLLHGWAEELTKEPFRAHWTDGELEALIDGVRERVGLELGEPRFWPVLRQVHVRMAKGFLQKEKEWRSAHPKGETRARELDVRVYWDREKKDFVREPRDVVFRGRIDRVDSDGQGHYAVLDYKSSKNEVKNFGGWLDGDKYQLPVYSYWIERGLSELTAGPVVAALYYVMRDFDRSLGLVSDEAEPEFVSVKERSKSRISRADQEKLYAEVITRAGEFVEKVSEGRFQPEPRDRAFCESCRWRKLCRAPHLS